MSPGKRELQAGVTLDDREQVIEVMRDAGGELADGFHLLRLAKLRLEARSRSEISSTISSRCGFPGNR